MSLHPGSSPFLEVWLMGTKPYKPVEALHAQGKPWLRRAQPERMQGYLRQVTNQVFLAYSAYLSSASSYQFDTNNRTP